MCAMHDKGVDKLIEREWWNSRKEPRDERAGKREKKGKEGEKWFEGKVRLFAFV